jgi:hypothetical protein
VFIAASAVIQQCPVKTTGIRRTMTDRQKRLSATGSQRTIEEALNKIIHEIDAGLVHGFFEFTLTCEIVSQGRRRLTLRAGKSHQFVIPTEDCILPATAATSETGALTIQINQTRRIVNTTSTRQTPLASEREVLVAYGEHG